MKNKAGKLGLGLLLAVTHFAHAQQAADAPPISPDSKADIPGPVVEDTKPDTFGHYGIDLTTYEFLVDGLADPNSVLNSSEQIEARRRAFLQLLAPDEYYRQFPKTDEEIKLEQEALAAIARPLTPEEMALQYAPEELAEQKQAIEAFLATKPVADPNDARGAPGSPSVSQPEPVAKP